LELHIPIDRNSAFQQQTLAPYNRSNDTLEQFVIHLYKKGITTDDIAEWHKVYPRAVDAVMKQDSLFTFYDFPASIRPSIYSTNLIEGFNKEIKRYNKRKEQFSNENVLERFLVI